MNPKIKILFMDVDGTLTDGCIYMGQNGEVMKAFSVKDGYGVKMLRDAGIVPVILTARQSQIVANRARELSIVETHQNIQDKPSALQSICQKYAFSLEEAAYFGDDMNDKDCMQLCALCGCPADAASGIKKIASYVCASGGGHGALREFAEWLLS